MIFMYMSTYIIYLRQIHACQKTTWEFYNSHFSIEIYFHIILLFSIQRKL